MPKALLLLTAGAIAASIGIKASLPPAARAFDPGAAAAALQREAAQRGYSANLVPGGATIPLVIASYESCRRRLFVLDPLGSQKAKVETLRQPGEREVFHYRGAQRPDFPRFEPVVRNYAQAYLGNLGVIVTVPAIVAELSAGDCQGAPALPLGALRVGTSEPTGS